MTGALMTAAGFPMKIFISYSHVDDELFKALELRLRGIDDIFPDIDAWSDQRIPAGGDWHGEIQAGLNAADVVLLLVSPEFKASRYIRDHELEPALAREARGECVVVPVILRDTPLWERSKFARLQALPSGGKPVKSWRSRDKAWKDVVENLEKTAKAKGLLRAATPDRRPPPPRAKNAVFHVPFTRNPYFAGRAAELDWLHGALNTPDKRAAALLAGIGGVGKTATAAEYALLHRNDYRVVWWVEAETAEGRDLAFAGLAAKLRQPGYQSPKPAEVRAVVHQWLSDHDDWLLIFDNAEAPADLNGWLPPHPAGHALITSRNPAWGVHAQPRAVKEWDVPTAAAFLLKRSRSKDEAAARELAEKLGGLPLACEQAGAYIEANGVSLRRYITLLDASFADMLSEGAEPDIHPSLTAAVQFRLHSLADECPMALEILRTLACFAPDDIPRFLFDKWEGGDAQPVDEAVGLLLRRALLRGVEDNLSVHRLVQCLIHIDDPNPAATQARAVALLKANLIGHPQTDAHLWPTYAALLPHATALFAVLPDPPPEPAAAGYVCSQFGLFVQYARGDYPAAKDWLMRALRIGEAYLPADASILAASINNLGTALRQLGDFDGAADCFRRALKIDEALYGPDHPKVGIRVNNLGGVLWRQGDLVGAKACFERALRIDEVYFGSEHPNVATNINNLGALLEELGDLAGAMAHYHRALKIDEAHYGPDHPNVARDLNNLGALSYGEGDCKEAVALHRRALTIRQKHLPPEHPDVQQSRRHLALAEAALAAPPASPPARPRRPLHTKKFLRLPADMARTFNPAALRADSVDLFQRVLALGPGGDAQPLFALNDLPDDVPAGGRMLSPTTLIVESPDIAAFLAGRGAAVYDDVQFRIFDDPAVPEDPRLRYWQAASGGQQQERTPGSLDDVVRQINAPAAWTFSQGENATIIVMDTGIDGQLPEIGGNRRQFFNPDSFHVDRHWIDKKGHGSMCAAIAAGGGPGARFQGVAPAARVVSCRTDLSASDISLLYLLLVQAKRKGELTGPLIVNNSYGFEECQASGVMPEDHPFFEAIETAINDGVVVVFAAGNNHYDEVCNYDPTADGPQTIWGPNSHDRVLSVGTVNRNESNRDPATPHVNSSRGPGEWAKSLPKPDCVAPTYGDVIWGADVTNMAWWGTSGAAPQAAGLAALIQSHAVQSLGGAFQPDEVNDIIRTSCRKLDGEPAACVGKGMIDCAAALKEAEQRRKGG
jgi:serine protease AprX